MDKGKVYLVGAGPGDPKLITVKGLECVKKAEVLVYDRLSSPRLLAYAKPDCELIYVGKKPDRHTLRQEEINQLLVDKALEGKIVTRLKGGDPCIFGRVGEEAELLVDNGVEFEIVPGITSGIAVPAYAGIPVTHRDYNSSFAIVTGHEDPEKMESSIDWDKLSTATGTIAFYMGISNLATIVKNLVKHGRPATTPVALIRWGTRPEQWTLTGTLETIVETVEKAKFTSPAIILVGEVVRLREKLNWYEKKPLFGQRVLVTRARSQASDLSDMIEDLGGEPYEFPTIQILPPNDVQSIDNALAKLGEYDWIIFTSPNGVSYFMNYLKEKKIDIRAFGKAKIACVGPKTSELLENYGLVVDVLPSQFIAEGLLDSIEDQLKPGQKILLPRADIARKTLPEELKKRGLEVTEIDTYETKMDASNVEEVIELLQENRIQIITFTSSSTASNFVEALSSTGEDAMALIQGVKVVSIGAMTTKTCQELGMIVTVEADESTLVGLVNATIQAAAK
ncbi:uroporphyrinogen-III C-methyltransferase [Desulfuribacillus stibiiarsenatis]|uniref:uroporphyrinogen-III C-methyltransferase n=1 Tax=Desulfuribacillus stibiiarsenatis TaxID=1390249 RepID=A0A1E5L2P8_9FIRM|nr:uroporphyrinogen-III C-methyltransferase [Desulfuribacillus stibiiarsenatis]OEH84199.1 uroporphyrinogen-III C-methyltransferase [Desulfuribacillus stibiiarsenatis]